MKTPRHSFKRYIHGGAMVMVLLLTVVTGIALTSWMYLLANRLLQANSAKHSIGRQTAWRSAAAINREYALKYQFRESITREESTAVSPILKETVGTTTSNLNALEYTSLRFGKENPFDTTEPGLDAFNSTSTGGAYNNITSVNNSAIYVTETRAGRQTLNYDAPYSASSPRRADRTDYFNYQRSYPRTLLGDLLIAHRSPNGSTYSVASNIAVNGRVLILDDGADVSNVKADSAWNLTPTGTRSTLNREGTARKTPQNLPALPIFTEGAGNSTTGGAVLDGTLNVISNGTFNPASIEKRVEDAGIKWVHVGRSNTYSKSADEYFSTAISPSNSTSYTKTGSGSYQTGLAFVANINSSSNTAWAYRTLYTPDTRVNKLTITLNSVNTASDVQVAIRILHNDTVGDDGGIEQLELLGQTVSNQNSNGSFTKAAAMRPLVIWIEQERLPQILMNHENGRPLILLIGQQRDRILDMYWIGSSYYSTSSELEWRLQLFNQRTSINSYSALRFLVHPTSSMNVEIIGGIRTNSAITTDTTSTTTRFILNRETSSSVVTALLPLLPRDAWLDVRTYQ